MFKLLPHVDVPRWLASLTPAMIDNGEFPLKDILRNSLFYPSAGFNGDPIKYLAGGNVHSFIYADTGYSDENVVRDLKAKPIQGYSPITAPRRIKESELAAPTLPFPTQGIPGPACSHYCAWVVFERNWDRSIYHGPSRFSLLYYGDEGVSAFQTLYLENRTTPRGVAILRPDRPSDTEATRHWQDYKHPSGEFARLVRRNPRGQPDFLFYGGGSESTALKSCWPDYPHYVDGYERFRFWGGNSDGTYWPGVFNSDGQVGVWSRNSKSNGTPTS